MIASNLIFICACAKRQIHTRLEVSNVVSTLQLLPRKYLNRFHYLTKVLLLTNGAFIAARFLFVFHRCLSFSLSIQTDPGLHLLPSANRQQAIRTMYKHLDIIKRARLMHLLLLRLFVDFFFPFLNNKRRRKIYNRYYLASRKLEFRHPPAQRAEDDK